MRIGCEGGRRERVFVSKDRSREFACAARKNAGEEPCESVVVRAVLRAWV
jgi:hypothetical protein